jgi:hypothetical protein
VRPKWEVADVITSHGESFLRAYPQSGQVIKTLTAIRDCRTAALGGHKQQCNCCGHVQYQYNSCRNRHCPKCQAVNREKWIWHREQELLPVSYFHIVFTLPCELNSLAIHKPRQAYNSLFTAAWQTIRQFGEDPRHLGGQTGMSAVLHTWGQNLSLHPHLHCIVPGGGITVAGKWKKARNQGKYLFPTKAMATVFRAKFMNLLRRSGVEIDQLTAKRIFQKPWVVYAKRPFLGPQQVIEYLGRYTHKIAISNHRITCIDTDGNVHFSWKDYRNAGKQSVMKLPVNEFLRRFCQHILPSGFVRIRHYGILSSRNKAVKLNQARSFFGLEAWQKPEAVTWQQVAQQRMNFIPDQCPVCKEGILRTVAIIDPQRGPPVGYFRIKISGYAA